MKNLTLENIIRVTGGRYLGDAAMLSTEVQSIVTDSRAVAEGSLFAAIRGEKADGHDFVAATFEKGALCALVEHTVESAGGNQIIVDDSVAALQRIAAFYRRQFSIPVLGITGSVGKTTCKEMVAAVLSQRYRVHKTAGNFNNDLGVPLTLFGLNESHELAIIEMGISHPGDMQRLAEMVQPTMAMYTIIGHAHLEFLKSREGIAAEKTVINDYLPENGKVFYNGDDDLLQKMLCHQKTISFGLGESCDVRAEQVETTAEGDTRCRIVCGERELSVTIPAFGEHMVYAALEGAAVGIELGLTDEEIVRGIASYEIVGHRARRIGTEVLTVIDDCYNANPTSTASAIRSVAHGAGRAVCILGDMLELGEQSAALHRSIGELANSCGVALVLCTGEQSRETAAGAGERGMWFENKRALIEALPQLLQSGDRVLVKASRSMAFEEITEALLKM